MGTTKNAVYKVHNGTDFDEIYFKTIASMVNMADGKNVEVKIQDILDLIVKNTGNTEIKVTDGGGTYMFNQNGAYFWWAVDIGAPFSVIMGIAVKQNQSNPAVCYIIHNNGLSLGASNSVGTQNINGGSASSIKFCSMRVSI